ncbi:hypothetical protein BC940DRAFT_168490 [Gongronella butleri]|nr:hypothetical protein BC940DRAFT_168490 [Gongronella butleri]
MPLCASCPLSCYTVFFFRSLPRCQPRIMMLNGWSCTICSCKMTTTARGVDGCRKVEKRASALPDRCWRADADVDAIEQVHDACVAGCAVAGESCDAIYSPDPASDGELGMARVAGCRAQMRVVVLIFVARCRVADCNHVVIVVVDAPQDVVANVYQFAAPSRPDTQSSGHRGFCRLGSIYSTCVVLCLALNKAS